MSPNCNTSCSFEFIAASLVFTDDSSTRNYVTIPGIYRPGAVGAGPDNSSEPALLLRKWSGIRAFACDECLEMSGTSHFDLPPDAEAPNLCQARFCKRRLTPPGSRMAVVGRLFPPASSLSYHEQCDADQN